MTDRRSRSTASGTDTESRRPDTRTGRQRDQWSPYWRGEHPTRELRLEAQCPDCGVSDPSYQHVVEHEPCGCIRPLEAFADAGGCPDCGGTTDAAVIARLYDCRDCDSRFDTPAYRLTASPPTGGGAVGDPVATTGTATETDTRADSLFQWGPPLESVDSGEPADSEEPTVPGPEAVSLTGGDD